jgi:heme O synthase-like polyprenyltransferase
VRDPSRDLARRNFLFSMQYLAGVFLAVVIDKHVPLSAIGL